MLRRKQNPTPPWPTPPPPSTNPNLQSSSIIQTFINRTSAKLSEMKGLKRQFIETENGGSTLDNCILSSPKVNNQERKIAISTPSSGATSRIMPLVTMTKDFKIDSFRTIRASHTSGTRHTSSTPSTSEDNFSSEINGDVGDLKVQSHDTFPPNNQAGMTYQTSFTESKTSPYTYNEWSSVVVDDYQSQVKKPASQSPLSKPSPLDVATYNRSSPTPERFIAESESEAEGAGDNDDIIVKKEGLLLPSQLFNIHGGNIEENSDDNMAALLIEAIEQEEEISEEGEDEDEDREEDREQDEVEETPIFRDPGVHDISSDSNSDSNCSDINAAVDPRGDIGLRNVIAANPHYPLYSQNQTQSHENDDTVSAINYYERVAKKIANESAYHSDDHVLPSIKDDQYQNGHNSNQNYQDDEIMEGSNIAPVQEDKAAHNFHPRPNAAKPSFNWNRRGRQRKSRYRTPTPVPLIQSSVREPSPSLSSIPDNSSINASEHEAHRSKRARHHYDTTGPADVKIQYLTANPPKHWAYGTIVPPEEWPIDVQEEHMHGVSQFYTDKKTGIPLFLGTIPYDVYYAQNAPASLLTAQMTETMRRNAPKTEQYRNESLQTRKRSHEMNLSECNANDTDTAPAKRQKREMLTQYNTSKYVHKPPVATTRYITVSERLIAESKAPMLADTARIQEEMERRKQVKLIQAQTPEYNHFINTPYGLPLTAENLAGLSYPRPSETLYNSMYYGHSPLQIGDQHEALVNALQKFDADHRLASSDPRFLARLESPSEDSVTLCGDGYEADEERESENEDRYAAQFDNGYTNYQHPTTQNQNYGDVSLIIKREDEYEDRYAAQFYNGFTNYQHPTTQNQHSGDSSPIMKCGGDGYQTEESDEYESEVQVFKREDSEYESGVPVVKREYSDEYDAEEQDYNEKEDDDGEYDGEGEYLNTVDEGRRYLEQKDW